MSEAGVAAPTVSTPVGVAQADVAMPAPAGAACSNCTSLRVSAFCAECGERQPSHIDTTLRHLGQEAYEEFINVDGRLWRSVVALLSRPGFLAQEYFAGRRSRYMRPFSLFVLLNVAFFIVQPYTGLLRYSYREYVGNDGPAARAEVRRAELGITEPALEAAFDATLQNQKKSMLLVAIPLFAGALLVLYAGSGRTYVEHLVFAVHAYAFTIFYMLASATVFLPTVLWGLLLLGVSRGLVLSVAGETGLIVTLASGVIVYVSVGLHRFYHSSWPASFARATVLFCVQALLIVTFRDALFTTVLLSL